uniref:Tetratricopeptide repeat domain 14 n=1 Tax=Xenopus tropicalis TaxID=8364 RepID=A0A7D9NJW8_XENTR
MEKDLVRQSLSQHGPSLLSLLKSEQHEHAGFKQLLGDLSKWPQYRKERNAENPELQQFIARKADLLFATSWKSNSQEKSEMQEVAQGSYAVMPPLEQFMEVPSAQKRELFFRDAERGDIVIGRITCIREFGFFLELLCMGSGILRDIKDLKINALCPVRDVPSQSSHGDPLSYYQTGDLIQAAVKDIDRFHEKLTLSLHKSALPTHQSFIKLGVISTDDMPEYYRQSLVLSDNLNTFEKILRQSLAFSNPSSVDILLSKLGIDESNPPSLIRGLQRENFRDQDYAPFLRKKQSSSWALKCVKHGVDYFKVGRHVDAMNEYNKALEIDDKNVEALVARGALYATKGSLNKAINDFEIALENCPNHRNARKYLCQTLVERGGQLEEEDKLLNAESYYSKVLTLDETFTEAEEALSKLRQRMQKKHKQGSSSSSSSGSSSDTSSSDSHKKQKKKKRRRKLSESSSRSKKSLSNDPSHHKEECYSPPANTSASFLNHKSEVPKMLKEHDRLGHRRASAARDRSLSSSSFEIMERIRGRSEDSIDSLSSTKTQASSSRTCSEASAGKYKSSRRDSTDLYKTEERHRNSSLDHLEEGRKSSRKSDLNLSKHVSADSKERRSSGNTSGLYKTHSQGNTSRACTDEQRIVESDKAQNGSAAATKCMSGDLLNILTQIADFEKEKGTKLKNK